MLARFETAYAALLSEETGLTFPVYGHDEPKTWYWERDHFASLGWTREAAKAVESKVWDRILSKGSTFWKSLAAFPHTFETLELLTVRSYLGDDVYFITTRPGHCAKRQTEYWLQNHGMDTPTVLIATSDAAKGLMAKALKLDVFIDDKPENCEEVARQADPACKIFLVDAPYNRSFNEEDLSIVRVPNVLDALRRVTETSSERIAA